MRRLLWLAPAMFVFGYLFVFLTEFRPTYRAAMIVSVSVTGFVLFIAGTIAAAGKDWLLVMQAVAFALGVIIFLIGA